MERFLPSLKIHQCVAEAEMSALELETDPLVYALRGLSMEEIKLTEGRAK